MSVFLLAIILLLLIKNSEDDSYFLDMRKSLFQVVSLLRPGMVNLARLMVVSFFRLRVVNFTGFSNQLRSPYSIYELMQILGISVFAKTPLNELLTKTQIKQNVKEQLNLFNFNEILTHH